MTRSKQVLTAQSNDTLETRKMLIFFPHMLIGLILLTVLGGGILLTRKFTELGMSFKCMEAGFKAV